VYCKNKCGFSAYWCCHPDAVKFVQINKEKLTMSKENHKDEDTKTEENQEEPDLDEK
jgi:hypothetical protein